MGVCVGVLFFMLGIVMEETGGMQIEASKAYQLALSLSDRLTEKQYQFVSAESCTGGGIASAVTAVPGSSQWFHGGFVTYSNEAKAKMLGVDAALISREGAVSEAVACAMAAGALRQTKAHCAIAVTGVAGPGGGSAQKPVGTVWFACATAAEKVDAVCMHFQGSRQQVREASVVYGLQFLLKNLI